MPRVFPPIAVRKEGGILVPLDVRVRCAVPDEGIRTHIKHNVQHGYPEVGMGQAHGDEMIIAASGPSLIDALPYLEEMYKYSDAKVMCVKSSHDYLVDRGIIPWGCILLDGREHVQRMFTPHPEVTYFTASMCAESTFEFLKGMDVVVWHAAVGANEKEVIKRKHVVVGGGSTSPLRAMPLGFTMGFRRFIFYGMDSCFDPQGRKIHDYLDTKKPDGTERAVRVWSAGREFLTTPEMVGQAQDFEAMTCQKGVPPMEITMVGDGLNKHRLDNSILFPQEELDAKNIPFFAPYQQNKAITDKKNLTAEDEKRMEKMKEIEYQKDPFDPSTKSKQMVKAA